MRRLKKLSKSPRTSALLAGCVAAVALLATASAAPAKTYRPTRTDDPKPNGCNPNNCSLREAVMAADNTQAPSCRASGPAHGKCPRIVLRPGRRYRLTRRSSGNDSPATGDLDLQVKAPSLSVFTVETPKGGSPATIDANGIDRIFDGATVLTLNRVVLRGGHARGHPTQTDISAGNGGAIYGGTIVIRNSRLVKNVADNSGGAIYSRGGGLEISKSRLKGNSAGADGGAFALDGEADRYMAEVTKTRATHNRAGGQAEWLR